MSNNTEEVVIEAPVAEVIAEVTEPKTRGRKPKNKQYFTKETENAILLYNQLENEYERNRLYDAEIKYPFDKLVENIIHTFKFYYLDVDSIEDLKLDVVSMLVEEKLFRFDPSPEYEEFKFSEFIIYIIKYLQEKTGISFNYENTAGKTIISAFSSCRAFSTMLAVMHIYDIDFNNIKNLYEKKKLNVHLSMPFIYLLDKYLNDFKKTCPDTRLPPSRGRKSTTLNFIIAES